MFVEHKQYQATPFRPLAANVPGHAKLWVDLKILESSGRAYKVCLPDQSPGTHPNLRTAWIPSSQVLTTGIVGFIGVPMDVRSVQMPAWLYRRVWEQLKGARS